VLEHKPYSAKIDVYSFGIVLWVLYSRREPYTELKRQWGSVSSLLFLYGFPLLRLITFCFPAVQTSRAM
jgi:hypothetical protein